MFSRSFQRNLMLGVCIEIDPLDILHKGSSWWDKISLLFYFFCLLCCVCFFFSFPVSCVSVCFDPVVGWCKGGSAESDDALRGLRKYCEKSCEKNTRWQETLHFNQIFMVHGITAFFCTLEKSPNCIWRAPYIYEHSEDGSYAYSLRVGEKLQCKIPPHPLLRSRCKNPPPPMPCYRQMFKFMIMLASCFTMGEAMGGRYSQNAGAGLSATALS